MKFTHLAVVLSVAALLHAAPAVAQVERVSRESQLVASYLIGAGADAVSGGASDSETDLDDRPSIAISGSDFNDGVVAGTPFTSAASFSASHSFVADEDPAGLRALTSSGSTTASASGSALASAGVNVRNPGNELTMGLLVTAPTFYNLSGFAQDDTADNVFGAVRLQVFSEGLGIYLPVALFTDTAFDTTGELAPGLYRIVGTASVQADKNETHSASWNYTLRLSPTGEFAAVPEPGTLPLALAASVLILFLSRPRRSRG